MEEGKIVGWLIKPGDSFSRGDPIIEIETDKTIAEFPALGDGRLKEVLVEIGDMIEVGRRLRASISAQVPTGPPRTVPMRNWRPKPQRHPKCRPDRPRIPRKSRAWMVSRARLTASARPPSHAGLRAATDST
ncbi:biotin/lipoyl-containing protein [Sinorhizobium meliloti]|nr:biotin/lipoyl-containing protein [Sinorhizobium meliloti]